MKSVTKQDGYELSVSNLSVCSLADEPRVMFFLLLSCQCLGGVGQRLLHQLLIALVVL